MMTGLLAAALRLPAWVKTAAAAVVVIGVLQVMHARKVGGLEDRLSEVRGERDAALTANGELRAGLADVQANRDVVVGKLREQGLALEALQARAKGAESAAALAAARAIEAGRRAAAELRKPDPESPAARVAPGHVAMNEWLATTFKAGAR